MVPSATLSLAPYGRRGHRWALNIHSVRVGVGVVQPRGQPQCLPPFPASRMVQLKPRARQGEAGREVMGSAPNPAVLG